MVTAEKETNHPKPTQVGDEPVIDTGNDTVRPADSNTATTYQADDAAPVIDAPTGDQSKDAVPEFDYFDPVGEEVLVAHFRTNGRYDLRMTQPLVTAKEAEVVRGIAQKINLLSMDARNLSGFLKSCTDLLWEVCPRAKSNESTRAPESVDSKKPE